MSALDIVATSTTSNVKKVVQTKPKDGIIYFTVSNANCLLKSGYFYCNYLLDNNEQKDNIDSMQQKLSNVYSATGETIDLVYAACVDTKNIFERFVSDYCIGFGDEEVEGKIKNHANIFKSTATILKQYLNSAAIKCGFDITFKTTKQSNAVKVHTGEAKTKPVARKVIKGSRKTETKTEEFELPLKKDNKDEVKDDKKDVKKDEVKKEDVKENKNTKKNIKDDDEEFDEEVKKMEEEEKEEKEKPKTQKRIIKKTRQIIDDDE